MALQPASKSFLLLGTCVPCLKQGASKFKVRRLEINSFLLMYFPKFEYVYAHDPDKLCKTGDIVLIEKLPEKLTRLITHKVKNVVYPLGDVTDPLTGEKVVVGQFRKDIETVAKTFGENKTGFKYREAPERGWQENKKDFTHLQTYIKYHEDGSNDPSAV